MEILKQPHMPNSTELNFLNATPDTHHLLFKKTINPLFLSQKYLPVENETFATLLYNIFEKLKFRSKQVRAEWIAKTISSKVLEN